MRNESETEAAREDREEKNNTQTARWYTMAACHLFGVQTHVIWTRPNHSKIKMWRGKSYYIDDTLDLGFVVATVAVTAFCCVWLLVLSAVGDTFGWAGALLLIALTATGAWFLWQYFISPRRAADMEKYFERLQVPPTQEQQRREP